MTACSISGLSDYYIYDGNPISCGSLEVWTNDGDMLIRDVDYTVYFDNVQPYVSSVGQHTLYAEGVEPYRGTLSAVFDVY